MSKTLFFQTIVRFFLGVILTGLLIFLPAGTVRYPNGWLFMGALFLPILTAGIVLMVKNPQLLQKRMQTKEQQLEQTLVVKLCALMFLVGFFVAGLDFRFQWSVLPHWLSPLATVILLISYGLYILVLRENPFLSRTVEVQENQTVVDTGMYRIIRHPMYSATILLFLSMPLVLGSFYSFLCFLPYPVLIAKRIQNEELVLEQGLPGYREYKQRVNYKLIPFIW